MEKKWAINVALGLLAARIVLLTNLSWKITSASEVLRAVVIVMCLPHVGICYRTGKSFHMIGTIAAIATIAEKKVQRSLRSYGNHSSAIVTIVVATIAEIDFSSISTIVTIVAIIWKPLSRDCSNRWDEKCTRM